jgi:hypothetical protein
VVWCPSSSDSEPDLISGWDNLRNQIGMVSLANLEAGSGWVRWCKIFDVRRLEGGLTLRMRLT